MQVTQKIAQQTDSLIRNTSFLNQCKDGSVLIKLGLNVVWGKTTHVRYI